MLNRIEAKLIRFSQSFFYFLVWIAYFLVLSPFIRIKLDGVENIPKKGRFILAGNHQNFLDGFLLAYALGPFKKVNFIIAKRALKLRSLQLLARIIGSVLIGGEFEEYQRALKKLNNVLSHGGVVGIFPEGDVSNRRVPRRFKGGVAKLSLDSKSKVIPIYIEGSYNLRNLNYWLQRPEILIKIGKPLELYSYASICGNNLDEMAAVLRERIIEVMGINEFDKVKNLTFSEPKSLLKV